MTRTLVCCFLLVLVLFSGSMAQDVLSLIENAVKVNEPTWQLSATERQPTSTIYRWKSGTESVVFEVFMKPSKQAAADLLREYQFRVPVPPKEELKGSGDEALLYQSASATNAMILFRKSNVFVRLTGSSVLHAKRFANHVAKAIP